MDLNKIKTIKINSNQKNKVIFSIAFDYGYLNEKDNEYGISHLVEHYLCAFLQKQIKCNEVFGSIDENYSLINIEFNKKDFNNFEANFNYEELKKEILNKIDKKIIEKESKMLISEINEIYSFKENQIKEEILKNLIKSPKIAYREKSKQIKNIKKLSTTKFKQNLEKVLNSRKIIFIDKADQTNTKKLKDKVFVKEYEVKFKKPQRLKIKNRNFKNDTALLCFKGLDFKSKTSERFSLRFLIQQINHNLEKVLSDEVYKTDYDNHLYPNFGLVWFNLTGYNYNKNTKNDFKKVVRNSLDDTDIVKKIEKFKKEQIKSVRMAWAEKENRNQWIIEDMLEEGSFKSPDQIIKDINKISKKDILKISSIFNIDKMYVVD